MGRFDCGIEGQQIGLAGDVGDGINDALERLHLPGQGLGPLHADSHFVGMSLHLLIDDGDHLFVLFALLVDHPHEGNALAHGFL